MTTQMHVGQALGAGNALEAEIVRHRQLMSMQWQEAVRRITGLEQAERTLATAFDRRVRELREMLATCQFDYVMMQVAPAGRGFADLLERGSADAASWTLKNSVNQELDRAIQEARVLLTQANQQLIGMSKRSRARTIIERYRQLIEDFVVQRRAVMNQISDATMERDVRATELRMEADVAVTAAAHLAENFLKQAPPAMQPWDATVWAEDLVLGVSPWAPTFAGSLFAVEDETMGMNRDFGSNQPVPLFVNLAGGLRLSYGDERPSAIGLAQSMLLRTLASVEPGQLEMCFFDPTGLGQSVDELLELGEFDQRLISGKVWSSAADLAARLADHTAHIELVIQKYLRSKYASIDEFNEAAGEIAEPYRMLVVYDFPTGFNDESYRQLQRIVENGPRCGVHTLLMHDVKAPIPSGVDPTMLPDSLRAIRVGAPFTAEHNGATATMRLEIDQLAAAPPGTAARTIEAIGRAVVGRTEAAIDFDKVLDLFCQSAGRGLRPDLPRLATPVSLADDATWWAASSVSGVSAPIGQKGAREAAILTLDSGDHAGALLVGRPGSGKSTLLHSFITGVMTLYSPEELELYLVDFKEGVEFKVYAEEALPHARCVAIESDREFGLSVLQSLQVELERRGDLLRSTGGRHAGLESLRRESGEKLPRIVLVFDEFHVLFAQNDKVGIAAGDLLELLIRQGRGFGIHVLLGSQSLAGLTALGSHVPQLLPVRLLLAAADDDARKVLGDANDAGQYLRSRGEGILNRSGGAVEANERFKGSLIDEQTRSEVAKRLRRRADDAGFLRRPIVFEGSGSIALPDAPTQFAEELSTAAGAPARLRIGSQ